MIWPFGRKAKTPLEILQGSEWKCQSCGELHRGMFDLGSFAPDPWPGEQQFEANSALRTDGNFLSEDFCVLDSEHFMVRCVLSLPVHGMTETFAFGVWGSLKRENFDAYVKHFDDQDFEPEQPWWSWLCNSPRPYVGGESVGCWMYPRSGNQRPKLIVNEDNHPLAVAQDGGISPAQVLDIYREYGHSPAA